MANTSTPTPEHGWVVCAPGDPTKAQWNRIYELSGDDRFCARRWNADTHEVWVEVTRANDATDDYTIKPNGELSADA